jgi:acyl carrier protein
MSTSNPVDAVETTVFRLLREVLPWQFAKKPIQPQLSLQNDLGLDSMGKVALAFRIEEELSLDLSGYMARVGKIQTVADVLQFIHEVSEDAARGKGA